MTALRSISPRRFRYQVATGGPSCRGARRGARDAKVLLE